MTTMFIRLPETRSSSCTNSSKRRAEAMTMAILLGGGIYTRQGNRLFQNAQILEDSRSVDVDLNQDSSVERKKITDWLFL